MNESTEVKIHFLDYWRVIRARWVIISTVFLLVVITAGVTCFFLPREYKSQVTVEVQQSSGLKIFSNEPMRGINDPKFVTTQFEIMQSKEILGPVIKELGLDKKWKEGARSLTPEEAYIRLRHPSKLQMHEIRNTDLIEVVIWDEDRNDAALIANTIANVYQRKRRTDQEEQIRSNLQQLRDEVEKQRDKVAKAADHAAQIRNRDKIIDLTPETMDAPETAQKNDVIQTQARAEDQKIEVIKLENQLETVKKLKPEQLMVALQTLELNDPTVMKTLPLYQETLAEQARLKSAGLGKNHHRIRQLEAMQMVYSQQLNDAAEALKSSLETKLMIAKGSMQMIAQKLDASKDEFLQDKKQSNEYIEAKSNYIQAKHVLEAAEQRLSTEQMQQQISFIPARIWNKAEIAPFPGRPNVFMIMGAATLIGLTLGIAIAFFIEYLDTSVKSVEDVERFLGVPVMAVVPQNIDILPHVSGDSADAEVYRMLKTNLEFTRKDPSQNSITLISGGPGEGKSTTLCNLAYTCAKGGYTVLVVDADLRRPSQHQLWEVDNSKGLTDYLTGRVADWQELVHRMSHENISFLPSGKLPEDAVGILNSQRMVELISSAKRKYDLVFFDSPPILSVSDGSVLSSEVDLTLMVIQHRRFPRQMLQRVKQAVLNSNGNLIGAVLNNLDNKSDHGYQYYASYGEYYSPRKKTKEPAKARSTRAANGSAKPAPVSRGNEDEEQY